MRDDMYNSSEQEMSDIMDPQAHFAAGGAILSGTFSPTLTGVEANKISLTLLFNTGAHDAIFVCLFSSTITFKQF
jgi:hypothetical protein